MFIELWNAKNTTRILDLIKYPFIHHFVTLVHTRIQRVKLTTRGGISILFSLGQYYFCIVIGSTNQILKYPMLYLRTHILSFYLSCYLNFEGTIFVVSVVPLSFYVRRY